MTEGTNVVAVYPDHEAAEQAVAKLRDASFDVTKLSIIGKDYHDGEKIVGYYTTGESMKYWGLRGAFWGGIWGLLLGAGFFMIPGVGSVLVDCPGDSLSDDASFYVGIGPADRASVFGVSADVSH
jgi:hypothetical protein